MIKRAIVLFLSLSTLVSYADGGPGDHLRRFDLPFEHVLLDYSSWLEDFVGVYFISNFEDGQRVKCVIENAYAGDVSAAWNSGSMAFTGNKTVIFTKKKPTDPDEYYVQPNTPQIFITDHAPEKWKSYASCKLIT